LLSPGEGLRPRQQLVRQADAPEQFACVGLLLLARPLLLMAPYSKKLNYHLYVHLKYPRDVPKEFLKEFERLVDSFAGNENGG
jgi:hypothetical protein